MIIDDNNRKKGMKMSERNRKPCALGRLRLSKKRRATAGLEKATSGQVSKEGRPILEAGPDRMVMFQEAALFPWLKVIDNVEYGTKIKGINKRERREKTIHYLKMVYLTRFATAYPLTMGRDLHDMNQVAGIMMVIVILGLAIDRLAFGKVEHAILYRWGLTKS